MNLEKNYLIQMLKTFTAGEWKEFEKFSSSPYFNKGRNYLPMLKILKKYYPDFDSPEFTHQTIYKKLYPGKKYKQSVLNSMLSRLYSIGEEYLIQSSLKKSTGKIKEVLILKELRSRGITLKVSKLISESVLYFEKKKFSSEDFEDLKNLNEQFYYIHQSNNEREKYDSSVRTIIQFLIYFFLTEIFFNVSGALGNKLYWTSDFNTSYVSQLLGCIDFQKMMDLISKNDRKYFMPIYLYYLTCMTSRFPENNDNYFLLKKTFFENQDKLDTDTQKQFIYELLNHCIARHVGGNEEFKYEMFALRKKIQDENLFSTTNKYMRISEFRTTFVNALNINETDWAEEFMQNNIVKLDPKFRTELSNYCKARIAFVRKDFNKALEHANKVRINQITYKLDLKNLMSKIYYDTGSTEPLYSLLSTYMQMLNNSKSHNTDFITRHKNFVKYLKKLADLKNSRSDSIEIEILKKEILKENVSMKTWLIQRTDELIKQ